jgi:hypothetical protein
MLLGLHDDDFLLFGEVSFHILTVFNNFSDIFSESMSVCCKLVMPQRGCICVFIAAAQAASTSKRAFSSTRLRQEQPLLGSQPCPTNLILE